MDDYAIRLLTGADLQGALRLSSTAGWNQGLEDWRMLVELAPAASFAAFWQDRVVGTAIGIDYGRFSWVAMMLVDPAHRGRGLGRRLLDAAIRAVPSDRPIRLDATPMGRPLYQACGFQDEAVLTRHLAEPDGRHPHGPVDGRIGVRPMAAADLDAVAAGDAAAFGGARRAVLAWALASAGEYAHLTETDADPVQYCLGRRGRLFDQIGPVVAAEDEAACALVSTALAAAGGRAVVIDSFDSRGRFTEWLRARGFRAERPLFRMRRPPARSAIAREPERTPLAEFAIFGPEFA